MSQAVAVAREPAIATDRRVSGSRVATWLSRIVFSALLGLMVLVAVPYGTTQPWWIALFVCAVFLLAILWLIEGYLSNSWFGESIPVVLPIIALATFSLFQTVRLPISSPAPAGISYSLWRAISLDPYQTKFFAIQLLALTVTGIMLFCYATSERRLRVLINVVVGIAVVCAVVGILRQTTQHDGSFGLPFLKPNIGFAQFINKNHFALLMEMAFGLALGLILGRDLRRERALVYFALLLPIWTGVLLCGSRGGLIAMAAQLLVAGLLYSALLKREGVSRNSGRVFKLTSSWPVKIALVFILAIGVALGTIWAGGDRLTQTIDESHKQLTEAPSEPRQGVSRSEIWRTTCKIFAAHPFFGVGMGAYWVAVPAFHDASGKLTPQEAHNDYLEILASGGLVGFAMVVWFGWVLIRRIRENLGSPHRFRRAACFGATIGITGVAIHSLLDFGLHTMINAFVFTTLIVIATSKPHWANEPASLYD